MKKSIIYYSLFGNNEEIAQSIADKEKEEPIEFGCGNILRVFQFFWGKTKLEKKARKSNSEIKNSEKIMICSPI